ncbi:MAG: ATP-binding protein [Archangium sp.]|nr:ATP-binding protein [Archangium sp.]MDP3569034.1 ATP-binding protein [Archangium sp.]
MLPSSAAGGGATSYLQDVLSVDAARRQRSASRIGLFLGFAGIPILLQTLLTLHGPLRFGMALLVLALSLMGPAAAWLARSGRGTLAGLWLTALPSLGSLIAVATSHQFGAAPLYCGLAIVVALATLEGRALWAGLIGVLLCVLGTVLLMLFIEVLPTRIEQLLLNSVVALLLMALVAGLQGRAYRRTLEEVAAHQSRAAELEARYRLIAENTTDLVALLDASNTVVYASPSFMKVLGLDPKGGPARAALSDEDEASSLDTVLAVVRGGQVARSQIKRRRADGTIGRFECVCSPAADSGLVLCVARDVTAERAMLSELEQAKKMEALGRFAGSIAHDFNNLLSVMRTCTTLAAQNVPRDGTAQAELNDVQEAISRASGLTSQLLAFSRRDVVLPKRVEVGPLLARASELAQRLVGERVKVELEVDPETWALWSGPSQLEQIVMNLAANARDAMPEGGTLRLTARNAPGSVVGDAVFLSFSDTGTGMSPETRSHLFEPFFTTKAPGIGTGLGLATVFGVVNALGGVIEVQSELGKGTDFRIWLPRALDGVDVIVPALSPPRRQRRPNEATVLVVDDDADVRSLMVRLIAHEGFQVLPAANAEQAMAMSLTLSELPVLVTDVMLTGRDGLWLAQRLLDRFPSMRVVLVSGFAPDPVAAARLVSRGARFVQKPFRPGSLVQAVRESLGLPGPSSSPPLVRPEHQS